MKKYKATENNSIGTERKIIDKNTIRDAVDYIFRKNDFSPTRIKTADCSLKVVENSEYHYYKMTGFTANFEAFKNCMKLMPNRNLIHPIYLNGEELNEKQTKQFWEQFDKFSAKNNKK